MKTTPDELTALLRKWLALPEKRFARTPTVSATAIHCDCAGLITLAFDRLSIPKPYALTRPRAVHYFAILQEIGSNHISQLEPGSLLTWRKDQVPKSGDSGHVLVVAGRPVQCTEHAYKLSVIDATKVHNGLAQREICVHTNAEGQLTGVQLHLSVRKVKRTAIYHAPVVDTRYCLGCGLPRKVCLCQKIEAKPMRRKVVILRHPRERRKTLSTVSLIKQRYPQVLVKEGHVFPPIRTRNCALLFPTSSSDDMTPPQAVTQRWSGVREDNEQTLLLLDATWRKAKRMVHENPWLRALPRISLEPQTRSEYLLRKGPGGQALSTLEAFALVQNDSALVARLQEFMTQQVELMGADVYRRNYRGHHNYSPPDC